MSGYARWWMPEAAGVQDHVHICMRERSCQRVDLSTSRLGSWGARCTVHPVLHVNRSG